MTHRPTQEIYVPKQRRSLQMQSNASIDRPPRQTGRRSYPSNTYVPPHARNNFRSSLDSSVGESTDRFTKLNLNSSHPLDPLEPTRDAVCPWDDVVHQPIIVHQQSFSPTFEKEVVNRLTHVIEIYNFPSSFTDVDITSCFMEHIENGLNIVWVDDNHAVLVFPSAAIANKVLNNFNSFTIAVRPLSESSPKTITKCCQNFECLLQGPPPARKPATNVNVARRMVTNALGVKSNVSKAQVSAERQQISDAQARKREIQKQKDNAWEGNFD